MSFEHEVTQISPQHVKPFVQGNKNDKNDAQAIVIASQQDGMPTVPIKTVEQQEVQMLHRYRESFGVRGLIHRSLDGQPWDDVSSLFPKVRRGHTISFGEGTLGKKSKTFIRGIFIGHFGVKKGRKTTKIRFPDANKKLAQMNSEPWILITNLHQHPEWGNYAKARLARLCKNIYAKRMQIEQNFRDDKSTVSGLK